MPLTDAPEQAPQPSGSALRKILPFTTVGVIIAALYVAWTFYSRAESNRKAQADIEARKAAHDKEVAQQIFGGGEIKFTQFTADTGLLKRGDHTQLCYGVVNAKNLKLDPPVEPVQPSYRHCVEIAPKATTTYTLTADDGAGHSKSMSLTVRVE
jgi:hypothetical protein